MKKLLILALLTLASCGAKHVTLPPGYLLPGTQCEGFIFAVNGAAAQTCPYLMERFERAAKRYAALFGPDVFNVTPFAHDLNIIYVPPDPACVEKFKAQCQFTTANARGYKVAWFEPDLLSYPIMWVVDQTAGPPPPEASLEDHEWVHFFGWDFHHPYWMEMEHGTENDPFRI